METWDAIRARRNVRVYTPDPVPEADLLRIAEAGWRAPSASNRQHWDFVIVTDREQLTELAKVWEQGGRHIARSAATIALVAGEPEDERRRDLLMYDLGQAIKEKNEAKYTTAYGQLTEACNSCHLGARQVPIAIQEPKESMFPDQDFRPSPEGGR